MAALTDITDLSRRLLLNKANIRQDGMEYALNVVLKYEVEGVQLCRCDYFIRRLIKNYILPGLEDVYELTEFLEDFFVFMTSTEVSIKDSHESNDVTRSA